MICDWLVGLCASANQNSPNKDSLFGVPDNAVARGNFKMADPVFHLSGKRIDKLKVDELKAELEQRGLKKSGNKGVLVERLQEVVICCVW